MAVIIYQPPLIVGVNAEKPDEPVEVEFQSYPAGKFVVGVNEKDTVGLSGLIYAKSRDKMYLDYLFHRDIINYLTKLGRDLRPQKLLLGGGILSFDHAQKTLMVYGESDSFGNVPISIIQGCLQGLEHKLDIYGDQKKKFVRIKDADVEKWYIDHEFDVMF